MFIHNSNAYQNFNREHQKEKEVSNSPLIQAVTLELLRLNNLNAHYITPVTDTPIQKQGIDCLVSLSPLLDLRIENKFRYSFFTDFLIELGHNRVNQFNETHFVPGWIDRVNTVNALLYWILPLNVVVWVETTSLHRAYTVNKNNWFNDSRIKTAHDTNSRQTTFNLPLSWSEAQLLSVKIQPYHYGMWTDFNFIQGKFNGISLMQIAIPTQNKPYYSINA